MNFPSILNEDVLTIFVNGEPHQVQREHSNFQVVKDALNDPSTTIQEMLNVLDEAQNVASAFVGKANAEVRDGALRVNNRTVHSTLGYRVIDIVREGLDVDPWLAFVENVYSNPNPTARDELYDFLEKHTLPITEDGHFLAYKKVSDNYKDVWSGKFDNRVGQTHEMPREKVDHDRTRTCSQGFHFCSREYLKSFGGTRIVILKINPADVVSIPNDYDFAKGRCWRYEVVGEIEPEIIDSFEWDPIIYDDLDDDDLDDDDLDDPYSGWYENNELEDDDEEDDDDDEEDDESPWPIRFVSPETPTEAPLSDVEVQAPPPYQGPVASTTEAPSPTTEARQRSRSIWSKLRGK